LTVSLHRVRRVAGIDTSYDGTRYAVALVTFCDEELDSIKTDAGDLSTPYVSKLFFLREAPILSRMLFREPIDLLFINGHGACHPYFFGLATVVGWTHRIPSIGIASRLIKGAYGRLPSRHPGIDFITLRSHVVGAAIRMEGFTKSVVVSTGFGVGLDDAIREYMHWTRFGKMPEPLRLAHLRARILLRGGPARKSACDEPRPENL